MMIMKNKKLNKIFNLNKTLCLALFLILLIIFTSGMVSAKESNGKLRIASGKTADVIEKNQESQNHFDTLETRERTCNMEISTPGLTILTEDITGCTEDYIITITANDVILDCDGHAIQGTCSKGIYVNNVDNVTVKNCDINLNGANSFYGIYYDNSNDGLIEDNVVWVSGSSAVRLTSSSNNTITANYATAYGDGAISFHSGSDNNTIIDNTAITQDDFSVILHSSSNNIISGNIVYANSWYAIHLHLGSNNNVIADNTATATQHTINLDSSTNNIITNNNVLANEYYSICLDSSSNNIITNNTATANEDFAIDLDSSSNNIVANNIFTAEDSAIHIYFSSNNAITSNHATSSNNFAINIHSSSNNAIASNILTAEDYTVRLLSSSNNAVVNNYVAANDDCAFRISSSSDNTIKNNNAVANSYTIFLEDSSSNNMIKSNFITADNQDAIRFDSGSSNNEMVNNYFAANTAYVIYDGTEDSITNTLIYNNSFGEVKWNSADLTITEAGALGLGNGISISNNLIDVDSSSFSGLNQPASLIFYDVLVSGVAAPFRNGDVCDASICTDFVNNGNDYWFDVNQFTSYSVGDLLLEPAPYVENQTQTY